MRMMGSSNLSGEEGQLSKFNIFDQAVNVISRKIDAD